MKLIASIFLFSSFLSFGQFGIPIYHDSLEFKSSIDFRISHDIQSSAIQNNLSSKLINGGLISSEIINSNLKNHKEINRLGREFVGDLTYITNLAGKDSNFFSNWGLMVNLGYNSLLSANYSKDLYSFVFKGNQGFIGDTADFSGTAFKYIDFQTIGFGLSHKKSKSNFSINLVNVQNYLDASINNSDLIFSADSSNIQVNLDGSLKSTYSSRFDKGLGLSTNFDWLIEVPWKQDSKAFFKFQVRDLGFAKVQQIGRYQVDTTLNYGGFTFDELINFNTNVFQNNKWQDTLNIKVDSISSWIMLPVMIQLGKVVNNQSKEKLQSFFGVKLYPTILYVPKIYFGLDYNFAKGIHAGISAAYGGFGNLRFGTYFSLIKENISLGVGSEDLYGLISKNGFGQMLGIQFKYTFR